MGQTHKRGPVFGALNLDYTYTVDHIVKPGETISSGGMKCNPGGKGLNQAVTLRRAGGRISIAGKIGSDGEMLKAVCEKSEIDASNLMRSSLPTGNSMIQVDCKGENSIILFPGANHDQTEEEMIRVLENFSEGDYLFLQNEINGMDLLIRGGHHRGMKIVLNPSPYESTLMSCALDQVEWFILNEIEICQMTGETDCEKAYETMKREYPEAKIVLTMGKKGAKCYEEGKEYVQKAYPCDVEDTTAAGDTFTGYFLLT